MDHERILNEYVHAADRMSELSGVGLKGPISIEILTKKEFMKSISLLRMVNL